MSWDYHALAQDLGLQGELHGRQFRGRCPLHDDRSPSFSLNIDSGAWTCYTGCGPAHGRGFVLLVSLVRDCSYSEAFAWMRGADRDQPEEDVAAQLRAKLEPEPGPDAAEPLGNLADYYFDCSAQIIPISFLARGFSWETIAKWGIRYDPMADAIVIPYVDYDRTLKGIIKRFMQPGTGPRYMYNTEWHKHEALYGLPQCAPGGIILVEGALDAIYLHQHGYQAAAILGSSLSIEQAMLLQQKGFTSIGLGFDNDLAGLEATEKALGTLVETGSLLTDISWVRWPDGHKDANDNMTGEMLAEAIAAKQSLI